MRGRSEAWARNSHLARRAIQRSPSAPGGDGSVLLPVSVARVMITIRNDAHEGRPLATTISSEAVQSVRARRGLLWVCQRHDLSPGASPHPFDLPGAEAALRYRSGPSPEDNALARLYWEAVWLEGARSPLMAALRTASQPDAATVGRNVVLLSSEADAVAEVAPEEFLPVSVLPGVIDDTVPPDARYGSMRARQRERVAYALVERLERLPRRTMFVVGAQIESDLKPLYDYLEDLRVVDLKLIILWPPSAGEPSLPENPGIRAELWEGSAADLAAALDQAGVPRAGDVPRWSVRIGNQVVDLDAPSTRRVVAQFALLTEKDLIEPDRIGMDDLLALLDGHLDNWKAISAGIAVDRAYVTDRSVSLGDDVLATLDELGRENGNRLTATLELPAESGSGATTLLRQTALRAAAAGYPTLVLRPQQIDVDLEDLRAFAAALIDKATAAGVKPSPMLVVFDNEHSTATQRQPVAQLLAAHGRKAVILQCVPARSQAGGGRRLPVLAASVLSGEVEECERTFREARSRWALPIDVPSLDRWRVYEHATKWRSPNLSEPTESLFWVALRFFLVQCIGSRHPLCVLLGLHLYLGRLAFRRTGRGGPG